MRSRILGVPLLLAAIAAPRSIAAQTMITLEVPVNVTKLAPEVQKIRVRVQSQQRSDCPRDSRRGAQCDGPGRGPGGRWAGWYPRCASCSHLPPVHSRNPSGRAHGTSVPWVVSPLMERVGSVIRSRAHYPCI